MTGYDARHERSMTKAVIQRFLIGPITPVLYSARLEMRMIHSQSRVEYCNFDTGAYISSVMINVCTL